MSSDKLDQMFDDALKRLKGTAGVSNAYGSDPLASDHLLLKKGWDYFKARIAAVESQFKDILDARQQAIEVLRKEVEAQKQTIQELEETKDEEDGVVWGLAEAQLKDYAQSDKDLADLKGRWEEEKIRYEEMIRAAEHAAETAESRFEKFKNQWAQRETLLRTQVDALRTDLEKSRLERIESERNGARQLEEKDEIETGLYQKVDILKGEVAARNELIQKFGKVKADLEAFISKLRDENLELKKAVQDREKDAAHLKDELSLLKKEKDILEKNWHAEQAEWRELWERQREMWDRSRRRRDED